MNKLTAFPLLNGGAGAPRTPGKDEAASGTLPSPQAVKPECDQHHYCPPNPQTRNRRLLSSPRPCRSLLTLFGPVYVSTVAGAVLSTPMPCF